MNCTFVAAVRFLSTLVRNAAEGSAGCSTFDGGSVLSYLQTVKAWLDENPSEVLTIVLTNPDNLTLSTLWAPAFEQSGIADLAYVPESLPTIEVSS